MRIYSISHLHINFITAYPALRKDYDSYFFVVLQPLATQGLLILEASRSHSDTQQSVELL